jgi:periplasmic protein TonB
VLIAKVEARYPDIAMRLNIQGDVVIRVLVGPDGRVTSLTVIKSPHQTLSEAARRAVQEYRYQPAMRNGEPIASHEDITVRFHLQ